LARSSTPLWAKNFTGPLYVPIEGRHALTSLEASGPGSFISELQRLSADGSPWASAALACIGLIPVQGANAAAAIQLCRVHADVGDPYACHILAWAFLIAGDDWRAIRYMRVAAEAGFHPAMVDFSKFVWSGVGTGKRQPWAGLKAIRLAHQAGHKAALLIQSALYRSGQLGVGRRFLGYLLYPAAALRYFLAMISDPFSADVFHFQRHARRPLLKSRARL